MKQAPPARSSETQQLMDLCYQVAEGKTAHYAQLESLALARKPVIEQASQGFFGELESESEEFHAKFQPQLDLIERMYEGYLGALDEILKFKSDPNPEKLQEAAFALSLASHGIASGMIAYQQAYLSQGPSLYPIVNLFTNLAPLYRQGQARSEDWKNTCYQYTGFYLTTLQEIDNSPHKSDVAVPERREALIKVMQSLEKLEALTPASASADFDGAISALQESVEALGQAIKQFNEAAITGPTASPGINTILMALNLVLEKGVSRDVLRNACEEQLAEVQKVIREVQAAAKIPTDSAVVREEGLKMLQGLESMEEALEMLTAFADSEEGLPEAAREAAKQLETATQEVHSATTTVQEANERYGKIACPACGAYNVPSNKNCEKCGRLLPQMTGSEEYGSWAQQRSAISERPEDHEGPIMTDVMQDLLESCEAYEKGKLEQHVLLAKLDRLEANIEPARAKVTSARMPAIPEDATEEERAHLEDVCELVAAAATVFAEGVETCEFGLAKMRQGITSDCRDDVVEGLQAYFAACQNFWQAEVIYRKFKAREEELDAEAAFEQANEEHSEDDGLA